MHGALLAVASRATQGKGAQVDLILSEAEQALILAARTFGPEIVSEVTDLLKAAWDKKSVDAVQAQAAKLASLAIFRAAYRVDT